MIKVCLDDWEEKKKCENNKIFHGLKKSGSATIQGRFIEDLDVVKTHVRRT